MNHKACLEFISLMPPSVISYCGGGQMGINFIKYFAILLHSEVNSGHRFNLVLRFLCGLYKPFKVI